MTDTNEEYLLQQILTVRAQVAGLQSIVETLTMVQAREMPNAEAFVMLLASQLDQVAAALPQEHSFAMSDLMDMKDTFESNVLEAIQN